MNVTREVIMDLLPAYSAGEASPATRALVEEYLRQDVEFAEMVRDRLADSFTEAVPASLSQDLELKTIRRTHRMLTMQRWLFGVGIGFFATALSLRFSIKDGHLGDFHFLFQHDPVGFGICMLIGIGCWVSCVPS